MSSKQPQEMVMPQKCEKIDPLLSLALSMSLSPNFRMRSIIAAQPFGPKRLTLTAINHYLSGPTGIIRYTRRVICLSIFNNLTSSSSALSDSKMKT